MNKTTFEFLENTIWMEIDGSSAGMIEISENCIEKVEIEESFRGKGFYKSLLLAALQMSELDSLRSNQRNSYSNPAWEKWVGEELEYTDECFVCIDGEGLFFTKE